MPLDIALRIMWARKLLCLLVMLLTVGGTVAFSLLWPKKYQATTQVLLDTKAPDQITGIYSPGTMSTSFLATEIDVITSKRVAERVVEALKLAENPALRDEHSKAKSVTPLRPWLAELILTRLRVKPSRDSSVIEITYEGVDPKFAAAMANAFATAYIETNLSLKVEPAKQQVAWFDERAKTLRANLERAQKVLTDYQRRTGIISIDERFDVENARLSELSSQLVSLQSQAIESGNRRKIAVQAAQSGAGAIDVPDVIGNPVVQSLKGEISRAENKQTEVLSSFGKNHPEYLKLEDELATMRARLLVEMSTVTSALGKSHALNVQREGEIRASLGRQREKVLEIKRQRDDFAVLTRDVESAQRAFDEVAQRSSKVSLESLARQNNVVVLVPASPPSDPSSPKLFINTIVSLVVGLLLVPMVVLGVELPNRRARGGGDVVGATGIPLICSVRMAKANRFAWRTVARNSYA